MKTGLPLIHARRLRERARDAGCHGLVKSIDEWVEMFYNRRQNLPAPKFSKMDLPTTDIVLDDAMERMEEEIRVRCGFVWNEAFEDWVDPVGFSLSEREAARDIECGFSMFWPLVRIAETLPDLPDEIRIPIDNFLARCVAK